MPFTIPGTLGLQPSLTGPEQPEEQKQRAQRAIAQARLDWITRPSLTTLLRVRWQRFYRTNPIPPPEELAATEARLAELTALLKTPEEWVSTETWTAAAEKAEDLEAELWAISGRASTG
jgi:hypothetical protein